MQAASIVWVMISTALVMVMLPGLSLFYSGLVRGKNALATAMHSFGCLAIVLVVWVLWGYSLAFGPTVGGVIGNLDHVALGGVSMDRYAPGQEIPRAAIHVVSRACSRPSRRRCWRGPSPSASNSARSAPFVVLWVTFVYCPIAHWIWGNGWIASQGALDFAGGFAVHMASGVAALAAAQVLGRRIVKDEETALQPHSLMIVLLGAGLLWFGWFGFNGGSALAANTVAVQAVVNTNLAAAAGALAWLLISWQRTHKPSVLGAASGAIAGLVGITPAAGYVTAMPALVIGIGASVCSYIAAESRINAMVDDALDVWAIHGIAGTWGCVALGLFAATSLTGGAGGLLTGNGDFFVSQIIGAVAVSIFAFAATWVIFKAIEMAIGLRPTAEEEALGLDAAEHGEVAYLNLAG